MLKIYVRLLVFCSFVSIIIILSLDCYLSGLFSKRLDDEEPRKLPLFSNNSNDPDYLNEFPTKGVLDFEQVFLDRRRHLQEACRRRTKFTPGDSPEHLEELVNLLTTQQRWSLRQFFVDEKNKVIFCTVPKVASTTWKRLLVVLSGATGARKIDDVDSEAVHGQQFWTNLSSLQTLDNYERSALTLRLQTFKKVMWVRHPLLRLVSAWKSKFAENNSYYISHVGVEIIKRIRPPMPRNTKISGEGVTLEEFLRWVTDDTKYTLFIPDDVHWARYIVHCWPCFMNYDYIGHFENNMADEANYLIQKLFKKRPKDLKIHFPEVDYHKEAATRHSTLELLANVTKQVIWDAIRRYEYDIDLFGYKMDPQWD